MSDEATVAVGNVIIAAIAVVVIGLLVGSVCYHNGWNAGYIQGYADTKAGIHREVK